MIKRRSIRDVEMKEKMRKEDEDEDKEEAEEKKVVRKNVM